jgi:hypothetical protein
MKDDCGGEVDLFNGIEIEREKLADFQRRTAEGLARQRKRDEEARSQFQAPSA